MGGRRLPGEGPWCGRWCCPASRWQRARSQVLQVTEGKAWQVRLPPSTPAPSGQPQDLSPTSASRAALPWAPARPLLHCSRRGPLSSPLSWGSRLSRKSFAQQSHLCHGALPPTSHNHPSSPAAAPPWLSAQNLLPGRSQAPKFKLTQTQPISPPLIYHVCMRILNSGSGSDHLSRWPSTDVGLAWTFFALRHPLSTLHVPAARPELRLRPSLGNERP